MIDFDKPLLSDKDRQKLVEVRQMLENDKNPFSYIGDMKTQPPPEIKLKAKHRLKSKTFSDTVGKHNWSFIDGIVEVDPAIYDPTCLACSKPLTSIVSIYGKVVVDMIKKVIESVKTIDGRLVETRMVIHFPVFKTGYACKQCFDLLWASRYYDVNGFLHRGMEVLERPINKTTETVTKNHRTVKHVVPLERVSSSRDDNLPRGKEEVKSTTVVFHDRKTGEEVEEWKTNEFIQPPEPVDGMAYNALHHSNTMGNVHKVANTNINRYWNRKRKR